MICDNCANSETCKKILQITATNCENFYDSPIAIEEYRKIISKDNVGNVIYYLFFNHEQKIINIHTGAIYINPFIQKTYEVVIHDSEFNYRRESLSTRTYNTIWFIDREILDKTLKEDYRDFTIKEYAPTISEDGRIKVLEWIKLRESKTIKNIDSIKRLGEAVSKNYYLSQLAREWGRPISANEQFYFSHDGTYYVRPNTVYYDYNWNNTSEIQPTMANEIEWIDFDRGTDNDR